MSNINGQVGGPAGNTKLSGTPVVRLDNFAAVVVSELQPRYTEAAYNGKIFSAGNQAAVASVALGTLANTGLTLSNPIGSQVNLVLMKVSYANSVILSAAGYLALETGYNASTNVTHTTPATTYNHLIGTGPASVGLVDTSCTLPTAPVHRMALAQCGTVATTGYGVTTPNVVDLEGSIILPPGGYISFYTFATNTAAWFFTYTWMELPV